MNDLLADLARLDRTPASPDEGVVAGDVARGHTALVRRRRTRVAFAGAGLTLGVGAALGVVTVVGDNGADLPPSATPQVSDSARQQPGSLALVAYTGAQPEGFELAKVPEGYVLQGSDPFVLTLARRGDDTHPLNFENKVVIMLESQDAQQRLGEGRDVVVDGGPGVLQGAPDETRTLRFFQGAHLVVVQVWGGIDLTDDQVVELAEGVTVTAAVEAGVG